MANQPLFLLFFVLTACASSGSGLVLPHRLAAFSQNGVSVEIALQQDASQKTFLAATFTAESGYHLYSKDLPREGIYGEGRPTLLELVPQSQMRSIGELTANKNAEVASMGTDALMVYPEGPVTLQLQVSLPAGTGWFDDQVSVTYMSCSRTTCRPPVVGKILRVHLPRMEVLQP